MKVLVLSQYWYPENGVPQRRWEWLTKILLDAGHEVVVIAPPPHYKRKVSMRSWVEAKGYKTAFQQVQGPNGELVLRSGFFPSGRSMTHRIFNQAWTAVAMSIGVVRKQGALRSYKPDLVIGTVPALPTAVVTYLASRRFGVPYVIDLRDAWPALFRESADWNAGTGEPSIRERVFSRGPFQLLASIAERAITIALRHASGIITTSEYLSAQFQEELSVPVATVRNVFPPAMKQQNNQEIDTEGSNARLRVLYAGTLGRAQKLENALRAAALAREEGVQVDLRFVGDGATWDSLRKTADQLGVRLQLDHQKSLDELDSYYQWADTALVHLTSWESLRAAIPSKTYELMENQIHISGVVQGETARLIGDLAAGDLVVPNNPEQLAHLWVMLANNRNLLRRGVKAREWVRYQREEVAPRNFLELIHQVGAFSED